MADTVMNPRPNPRRDRFVREYLIDFNGTQAAIRAGYAPRSAHVHASRMLNNAKVAADITESCLKIREKLEMNGDDVRRGFARIATDSRTEVAGGPSYMARLKALRELGLLLGLYEDKIHITGSVTLVDLLLAADQVTAHSVLPALEQRATG